MKKILIGLFLALAFFAGVSTKASKAETLPTINFETYNLGTINGQDGWTSTGSVGSGCAIYDHAVDSSNGTTGFGTKSLRISNAATSGCFGDQTFSKPLADSVGETSATSGSFSTGTRQRHFETQFDITSASPSAVQPGLVMSVSPDRGDGSRMSYLRFEDHSSSDMYTVETADTNHSVGSNYTNGIHIYFDDVTDPTHAMDTDTFNETDIATISRNAPHTIKLTLDTLDGPDNDVVKVWVDNVLKITGTSWEDYYRYDSEASVEQSPRIVKTVLFRTGGTAAPNTRGGGYLVDNLSLMSGPIITPTPTPINAFAVPAQCDQNIAYHLINGTNGPDNINGTSGDDLIYGLGGPDNIDGKGGNDCIVGGDGPDNIKGSAGDDVILGGTGPDSINGGDGKDTIYGEDGPDSISGGNGTDQLFGGEGADSLKGDDGADTIDGGPGIDSANGGLGNDTCTAESKTSC